MFWLKFIRDFIKVLSNGQTPQQIALGFALGSIIGLSPILTLQGILIWLIILLIDVNLSTVLVGIALFKMPAYLFNERNHFKIFRL